jgi:tripartite-type tricarboxylate transporter receptor subunit TctC
MKMSCGVRQFLAAISVVAVALAAAPAAAQDWPTRPIRAIVGFGPGGGTDIVARIIAPSISELLGQPFVIENKPGGGGVTAGDLVAKSAKDGYTGYMMNNAHGITAAIMKALPYEPVKDFDLVAMVGTTSYLIVTHPDFPARDLKALIAAAKANPGKLNYGTVGVGSTQHFAGELLRQMAAIDIKHIPYRTSPALIAALRSKEIDVAIETIPASQGQIRAGDLRAIAILAAKRFPTLPDVPTVEEQGVRGYDVSGWYGYALPAGASKPVVGKMNRVFNEVLGREAIRKQILDTGTVVETTTPEGFAKHVAADIAKWRAVREQAGIPQQ